MKVALVAILLTVSIVQRINALSCYVSDDDTLGTATNCEVAEIFCTITWVDGDVTGRACAETCTPSSTDSCCDSNDCNDATTVSTCIQCLDGTGCASSPCPTDGETTCMITWDEDAVESKTCTDTCISSSTVSCCNTEDCNDATTITASCIQCLDGTNCASSPCPTIGDTTCKVTWTAAGAIESKTCDTYADCDPDETTSCCTSLDGDCNDAVKQFKCYQCTSVDDCESTVSAPCAESNTIGCYTLYDSDDELYMQGCLTDTDNTGYDCKGENCNSSNALKSANLLAVLLISIVTRIKYF